MYCLDNTPSAIVLNLRRWVSPGAHGKPMLKFFFGVLFGAALAFGYVRWDVSLPDVVELPDDLRGNLISTVVESDLYALDGNLAKRQRALEMFLTNRPSFAVEVDAEFGHPFLEALYRKRAVREARQLRLQWSAYDKALSKPALRAQFEKKYDTRDPLLIKQEMLFAALERKPFLRSWMERQRPNLTKQNLLAVLVEVGVRPHVTSVPNG